MKASTAIMGILLISSVSLNVYYLTDQSGQPPEDPKCIITDGFGSVKKLTDDEVRNYKNQYLATLKDPDKIEGGIITRLALNDLFCSKDCNAISYEFLRDSTATHGPRGNGVFVVIKGVNVTYDAENDQITDVRKVNPNNYIGGYWCPPSCTP